MKKLTPIYVGLLPLAFLALFFGYPIAAIIGRGVSASGLADVWGDTGTWKIVWFTVWQAALSTGLTLALAFPMAVLLGRFKFRGQAILSALLIIPFVLPTLVVASAVLAAQNWLGIRGWLDNSVWAILLAHTFFNFALVVRIVGGHWASLDNRAELAARVLGASPLRTFFQITLPRLKASVITAASLTFFFSFTSFGVILILGGSRRATLDTEIWRYAISRRDFETAAVLALLQLLTVALMAFFNSRAAKSISGASAGADSRLRLTHKRHFGLAGLAFLIASVVLFIPLISLVLESFAPQSSGFGLGSYTALFDAGANVVNLKEAILNSLTYAVVATAMATLLGGLAAFAIFSLPRLAFFVEPLFLIPLGVSSVALGLGYLISLDSPIDLRSSWVIVPLAHCLIAMPFVLRPVLSQLRAMDKRLRWSAQILGANSLSTFLRIELPIVSRGLVVGAGFAFAISMGEFGASSFLARSDRPTIPTAIFRLLGRPGVLSYGQAMALSVVLILVLGVVIFLIDRVGGVRFSQMRFGNIKSKRNISGGLRSGSGGAGGDGSRSGGAGQTSGQLQIL